MTSEAVPERGWVADDVTEELAGLGIHFLVLNQGSGRSPRHVKDQLKELAGRFSGASAVNLRHQAIPWAYRVFFRHIGLDPDEQRTPVEEIALERMRKGRLSIAEPAGRRAHDRDRRVGRGASRVRCGQGRGPDRHQTERAR